MSRSFGATRGSKVLASTAPTISPGVVNTTTETTLVSLTVPAAELMAGDVLTFGVGWDVLNNSGSSVNYTYRLKYGGVTVGQSSAVAVGTSVQRVGARGTFHILLPTLATPRTWGEFTASFASSSFGGINTAHSGVLIPSAPAVDFSTDTAVVFTCQMGTAASTADFRLVAASIRRDRA
jgi:hypothetical protein